MLFKRNNKWGVYAPKDGKVVWVYESEDYGNAVVRIL